MNLKLRLVGMNFMQFFVWGCWLITIGAWWFNTKQWSNTEFGAIFSTMGIASIFMPAIAGIIADRWLNAERLYGIFHICASAVLFYIPSASSPNIMFWLMLVNMVFYMPTIALSITVSYSSMKAAGMNVVKEYPPIRVFGTVGFIVALWIISLSGLETSPFQFYIASISSLLLGLYAFTLPACKPLGKGQKKSFVNALGLNAFKLFKNPKMAMFFIFAMLLGASLQLTNAYGDTFLHDFAKMPKFADLLAVKFPAIIMSISQISETLFILTIPFFMRRFGIKKVMLFSMVAWVLRFGLFAYGDPGNGLWMIILSCIIYGMAFDFFNISGSLFVETQSEPEIRASAQGLFMMMTNGVGAILGSRLSGIVIDKYFMKYEHIETISKIKQTVIENNFLEKFSIKEIIINTPHEIITTIDNFLPRYSEIINFPQIRIDIFQKTIIMVKEWQGIWLTFAAYSLAVAVLFWILFKHKHNPAEFKEIHH